MKATTFFFPFDTDRVGIHDPQCPYGYFAYVFTPELVSLVVFLQDQDIPIEQRPDCMRYGIPMNLQPDEQISLFVSAVARGFSDRTTKLLVLDASSGELHTKEIKYTIHQGESVEYDRVYINFTDYGNDILAQNIMTEAQATWLPFEQEVLIPSVDGDATRV